jgi:hypothetical protein
MGGLKFRRGITRVALALTIAITSVGCGSIIERREFAPDARLRTVQAPGEEEFLAARHVVPPNAVDDRSVVLVYSTGARVVETWGPARSAELIVKFRARNDETVPLVMEPQNALLVVGPNRIEPVVMRPAWIDVDDPDRYQPDGSILVESGSTADWQVEFVWSGKRDPLRRLRSFLLSWTYRVGDAAFEESTRFAAQEDG